MRNSRLWTALPLVLISAVLASGAGCTRSGRVSIPESYDRADPGPAKQTVAPDHTRAVQQGLQAQHGIGSAGTSAGGASGPRGR